MRGATFGGGVEVCGGGVEVCGGGGGDDDGVVTDGGGDGGTGAGPGEVEGSKLRLPRPMPRPAPNRLTRRVVTTAIRCVRFIVALCGALFSFVWFRERRGHWSGEISVSEMRLLGGRAQFVFLFQCK